MMRFVEILRKLGILRYGHKSYTYSSAKNMPATAFVDSIYDEKKDLLSGNNHSDGNQSGAVKC